MTKTQPVRKPTQLEALTASTVQNNAHASTQDLMRTQVVLRCKRDTLEAQLGELTATATSVKTERDRVEAVLAGITEVIGKR